MSNAFVKFGWWAANRTVLLGIIMAATRNWLLARHFIAGGICAAYMILFIVDSFLEAHRLALGTPSEPKEGQRDGE